MPREKQKGNIWGRVLRAIRAGRGLDVAVEDTPWSAADWRRWIARNEERGSELVLAEREGVAAAQASLQARAVAAYGAWLTTVEDDIAEGKALNRDCVKELRMLMETKIKDLRPTKLKAEDAGDGDEGGFFS